MKSKWFVTQPTNIIRPFILANIGLFVMVSVIWLYPAVSSWFSARGVINREARIYAAYHAQAEEYTGLEVVDANRNILPYAYLAAAMDNLQSMARLHDLETTTFTASQPVSYYAATGERFVEIRAMAVFTGQEKNAEAFIYNLPSSAIFIRNLHIEFFDEEVATLRLEFSLFGREE